MLDKIWKVPSVGSRPNEAERVAGEMVPLELECNRGVKIVAEDMVCVP